MKNFKQNLRLAFAGIALLFVATVASVKAEYTADHTTNTANSTTVSSTNGDYSWPLPTCTPGTPGCL
jgi:hypothetical protein